MSEMQEKHVAGMASPFQINAMRVYYHACSQPFTSKRQLLRLNQPFL
jgi:hypothetical protein